jgi:hypothetical protein
MGRAQCILAEESCFHGHTAFGQGMCLTHRYTSQLEKLVVEGECACMSGCNIFLWFGSLCSYVLSITVILSHLCGHDFSTAGTLIVIDMVFCYFMLPWILVGDCQAAQHCWWPTCTWLQIRVVILTLVQFPIVHPLMHRADLARLCDCQHVACMCSFLLTLWMQINL